jgi:hypothetical protein
VQRRRRRGREGGRQDRKKQISLRLKSREEAVKTKRRNRKDHSPSPESW